MSARIRHGHRHGSIDENDQEETLSGPQQISWLSDTMESSSTEDLHAMTHQSSNVERSPNLGPSAERLSDLKARQEGQLKSSRNTQQDPSTFSARRSTRYDPQEKRVHRISDRTIQRRWSMIENKRLSRNLANFSNRLSDSWEYQGNFDQSSSGQHQGSARRLSSRLEFDSDNAVPRSKEPTVAGQHSDDSSPKYGFRFWMVMLALCVTQLLNAFEGTVTSTALPTIIEQLGGGNEFIWVTSGYFLTSTVFQPLYGQMADIFGRRWLMIFAVAMFVIGSGISGAAPTMDILILGRIVQGSGGGGINVVVNIIICDLVPLRDRGKFMAIVFAAISIGTSIGPFLGGLIVQNTTWRWVFYLNIPVGCASLALLFVFLKVNAAPTATLKEKLKQIDYGGNIIFIIGVTFILVALAYGGTLWAWSSYQTVVSLVFGVFSLVAFILYEGSNWCVKPTIPLRLFQNRTSVAAFTLTFLHSLLTLLVIYYLPVYFQAVMLASPTTSGVDMLPTVLIMVPLSAVSGALLSKLGRYKPFHYSGFALFALGLGCFITLDASTPTVGWVLVQVTAALGAGMVLSTLLPAAQAELPEGDVAAATGTWAFMRSFGIVWGVSVPAAIFDAQFNQLMYRIPDASLRAQLGNGGAYEHATADFLNSFDPLLRRTIVDVYADSLKAVWIFATAVAGLGFLLVFLERETVLRTKLETDFGLEEEEEKGGKRRRGVKNSISREPLVEQDTEMELV